MVTRTALTRKVTPAVIAELLEMVGFNLMAKHAMYEQNVEILNNYKNLILAKARHQKDWVVLYAIEAIGVN